MNRQRRTRLSEAHLLLGKAVSIVENARDEEQDGFNNLPENLQGGDRGGAMEEAIEDLQTAIDSINDAMEHIDRARNG